MNIWIVEDMLSSKRLEQLGMPSIALLGTHISDKLLKDILDYDPSAEIFLALDNDATAKAVGYKQKFGGMFRNFRVIPLSKDIKDMTEDELRGLLDG